MKRILFLLIFAAIPATVVAQSPPPCGITECYIDYPVQTHCFKCIGTEFDVGCTKLNCHQCDSTCVEGSASAPGTPQYLSCTSPVTDFVVAMGTGPDLHGVRLWRVRTNDAPAVLEAIFQNVGHLIYSGKITNLSATPIVSYRIGWLEVTRDGQRLFSTSNRIKVAPIMQFTKLPFRNQGPRVSSLHGAARGVAVFVAEVQFADGHHWQVSKDSLLKTQTAMRSTSLEEDPSAGRAKSLQPISLNVKTAFDIRQ